MVDWSYPPVVVLYATEPWPWPWWGLPYPPAVGA
jgi:hypothetical protein